jgi:hypothetical protein
MWELEEHVESALIEMQWKLHGNIMGKNKNPTLPPSCKRKKTWASGCMLPHSLATRNVFAYLYYLPFLA